MITFLGYLISEEEYAWYTKNSTVPIPVSTDTHVKSIIKGLKSHIETEVLYNCPCGYYPIRFKCPYICEKTINNMTRIRSLNIPLFRIQFNINSQIQALTKSIQKGTEAIICYMPFYQRMKAINHIKEQYPQIPVIVIVPDLVEHSYSHKGIGIRRNIAKLFRKIEADKINKLSKNVDGFVYLAEKMKDKFGSGKPYIIQEAIYDMNNMLTVQHTEDISTLYIFTYCGKLTQSNGIDRLIEAFMRINNPLMQLWLCGDGELLEYSRKKAEQDNRIVIYGHMPHNKVIEMEQRSTVLVNPRYAGLENAAYSFPSKLIEYLACGRPVITSHLAGIPKEYDSHVFYIEDDTIEAMKKAIETVLSFTKEQLNSIGKENIDFVAKEKSSIAQGEKLLDFIWELKENVGEQKK